MIYLDKETIGFTGPPLLIQYAVDDGPIVLHEFFNEPVEKTIELYEKLVDNDVCIFNATFDWFHTVKWYNVLLEIEDKTLPPDPEELWEIECKNPSRFVLKPKSCIDLFLYCRRGAYQHVMERKDLYIRKVPARIADELHSILEESVYLEPILRAKWKIEQIKRKRIVQNEDGEDVSEEYFDPDFVNIVLRFKPSGSLEAISQDVLGTGKAPSFFHLVRKPVEKNWRPYPGDHLTDKHGNPSRGWIDVFDEWKDLAHNHEGFRKYAEVDVELLQRLYQAFDCPEESYDDRLAICAANTRWKGFAVDLNAVKELIAENEKIVETFDEVNVNSPAQVLEYLKSELPPIVAMTLKDTKKKTIEKLAEKGYEVAQRILDVRQAGYYIKLFKKFDNGKFHASVKVIGALSGRMSGTDGINPQGIPRKYRAPFTFAFEGEELHGGDFDGFEVTIMEAVYNDPKLRESILSGKKLHGLFAEKMYKEVYDKIIEDTERYTKAKSGVFAMSYGAMEPKLAETLGLPLTEVNIGMRDFQEEFKGIGEYRKRNYDRFCSMRQAIPGGPVEWHEPEDYVESLLGFRRYFTIENRLCKDLFELANNPPGHWRKIKDRVLRRATKGPQTICGAVQSALFAAAFGLQAANLRAAMNHEIQATGAQINKGAQDDVWRIQPQGIHEWLVRPLNVHDELQCPAKKGLGDRVATAIKRAVERFKKTVPLLSMSWKQNCKNWKESH